MTVSTDFIIFIDVLITEKKKKTEKIAQLNTSNCWIAQFNSIGGVFFERFSR